MTPRLRRSHLLALTVTAVVLTGCSGPPHSGSAPSYDVKPADFSAIRHLLARRAQAVVADNQQAFMATVDKARPTFYRSQQVMFANLEALPVTSMSYEVGNAGLTDARGITGGPLLSPEVVENVFFRATDKRPVGNVVAETFVKRAGHWLLAADSTDTSETNGTSARPWAGPRISVAARGPLIVVADASQRGAAGRLADTVTRDLRFDSRILGVPMNDHVLVDATTGGSVMRFDNSQEAGAVTFPVSAIRDFERTRLAGYRIKVNPAQIKYLDVYPQLLRHELTHYLMYKYTGVNPKWLTEGLADYVAYQPGGLSTEDLSNRLYARLMSLPHELTASGNFGLHPYTDYALARACVTYLVHHGGMAKVETLMRTYASYPYETYEDSHTRQALEKVYGMTPKQVADGAFALLAGLD